MDRRRISLSPCRKIWEFLGSFKRCGFLGVESQVRLFGFGLRLEFGKELPSGFTVGLTLDLSGQLARFRGLGSCRRSCVDLLG